MRITKILVTLVVIFSVFMSRYLNPVVDCQLNKTDLYALLTENEFIQNNTEKNRILIDLSFNVFYATYKLSPCSKSPDKQGKTFAPESFNSNSYRAD